MLKKYWLGFLVSAALMMGASPSEAVIIKKYDFESGNFTGVGRQYQDKTCSSSSDYIDNSLFDIVSSPGGRSGNAVKHQIKNCDERSELLVANTNQLKVDQEYWVGWSYFFPDNFITSNPGKPTYTIIQQMPYKDSWKEQDEGKTLFDCNPVDTSKGYLKTAGSPGSEMEIAPDGKSFKYKVKYYRGKDSQGRYLIGCENVSIPAKLNSWQDFVMNFKFSSDPSKGFLKIWKNDKLYYSKNVALSRPGIDALGDWKIGAYVGDPNHGERIVYTDEIRVGDSASSYLDVVNPNRRDRLSSLSTTQSSLSLAEISFSSLDNSTLAENTLLKTVDAESVPEPTSAIALFTLLGGFGLLKQVSKNKQLIKEIEGCPD